MAVPCQFGPQKSLTGFQKNIFVLGSYEFLVMLEGKIRETPFKVQSGKIKVCQMFESTAPFPCKSVKETVAFSDASEPSWLEPQLELKDFQLGSARDLFSFSLKSKISQKGA